MKPIRNPVSSFLSLLAVASICHGDSVTQTDWSGGPGTLGPVLAVGDDFYCDTETSWAAAPGSLVCEYSAVPHAVGSGSPVDVCSADLDGDGDLDVVSAHWWHDRVDYHLNVNGSGTQWSSGTVVGGFDYPIAVTAGDMDGDGLDDVVASAYYDECLSLFLSPDQPGDPWVRNDVQNGIGVYFLDTCDIDGDGHLDILGTSLDPDRVSWWENSGTGAGWTWHIVTTGFDTPQCAKAVDMDLDGDQDILGVSYGYGRVVWWENVDGSGAVWTTHTIDGFYQFPSSVDAVDIDLDGDIDVVGTSYVHGKITLWENVDGTGTVWEERQIGSAGGAGSIAVGDIDLDGDVDLSVASVWLDRLLWVENLDGYGGEWVQHACAPYLAPAAMSLHDINGDGRPDFLSCSDEENTVTWWDHPADRYHPMGRLESSIVQIPGGGFPVDWGTIGWNGSEPAGTSLRFLVRSAGDPVSILSADWSDTLSVSGTELTGLLGQDDAYFQYKAVLSSNTLDTPVLEDVTITWNPLGVGEQGSAGSPEPGLHPAANPCRNGISVSFVPCPDQGAEIRVFDIAGRALRSGSFGNDVCGVFTVDGLPAGLYSVVMTSGSRSFRELLTILP